MSAPHLKYMLKVCPPNQMPYTLPFSNRPAADETAKRLVTAFGGHATLHIVQHLCDYWSKDVVPKVAEDRDLVA